MKTEPEIRQALELVEAAALQADAMTEPGMMLILVQTNECLRWVLDQIDGRKGTLMPRLLEKIAAKHARTN